MNGTTDKAVEPKESQPTELINGYTNANGHAETVTESKQEKSKQRTKKDEKTNAEFMNQIATTMQNLQRDLDRITARVRSLEGQTLQALMPQIVSVIKIKFRSLFHFYYLRLPAKR